MKMRRTLLLCLLLRMPVSVMNLHNSMHSNVCVIPPLFTDSTCTCTDFKKSITQECIDVFLFFLLLFFLILLIGLISIMFSVFAGEWKEDSLHSVRCNVLELWSWCAFENSRDYYSSPSSIYSQGHDCIQDSWRLHNPPLSIKYVGDLFVAE